MNRNELARRGFQEMELQHPTGGSAGVAQELHTITRRSADNEEFRIRLAAKEQARSAAGITGAAPGGAAHDFQKDVFGERGGAIGNHLRESKTLRLRWGRQGFLDAVLSEPGPGQVGPRLISITLPGKTEDLHKPSFQHNLKHLRRQVNRAMEVRP